MARLSSGEMLHDPLTLVLALLLASVLVVRWRAAARTCRRCWATWSSACWSARSCFGLMPDSAQTQLLAEIGVVFLLFTLGLEFSWPRMVAMRREVFGLGALQVALTTAAVRADRPRAGHVVAAGGGRWAARCRCPPPPSSSASSPSRPSSTARMAGLSFAILLFQDLAFVPLLALATAIAEGSSLHAFSLLGLLRRPWAPAWRRCWWCCWLGRLAAAAAVRRDRAQPPEGTVHAGGAARGAGLGVGHRARGPVAGARRIPGRHDAGRDRIPSSGGSRDPAFPRAAARPVLHLRGHAARHAADVRAVPAGRRSSWWAWCR